MLRLGLDLALNLIGFGFLTTQVLANLLAMSQVIG
jgi:hypothetical protein